MAASLREQADAKSRGAGLLLIVGGIVLIGLTWHWATGDQRYAVKAALIGPVVLALGIGLMVHGAEIPLDGIRPLTRIYGVVGSLGGILYLYSLGFFERPHAAEAARLLDRALPLVILGAWFLPDRFYGGRGHVPERPAGASIEPR